MKLSKNYEPNQYEQDIYALWEKSGAFKPQKRGNDETYSIVIPPPNANGDLHMGHGLTLAIEDIAMRYHRMQGKAVLFVPGADHAGFETQSVYEKRLAKEGKSRFDFTREELYSQIWDFVAQNRSNYESQFRKIGASLDWEHYTYTLDQKIVDRAYKTFKSLWDDKLIYRGERLVNFCTFHGTGFADIEVEYKEKQGHIWSLRYPLTDSSGEVVVATTRPETMLGDVAVAVHPDDERYAHLIGRTVKLPLSNREVPILADDFVDRNFGTGAVKITPAHDVNDYEVAQRHRLPMITVIAGDGTMNHNAPEAYQGMKVSEARERVVADLTDLGALAEVKEHINNVGHCYKCGTVIEPLLREQWFVSMKPLAQKAIETLNTGKIAFYPDSKREQLVRYLDNLRDWNVSRQIAWGIPIPAFQNIDDSDDWIFDTQTDQKVIERDGKTYHRDPDVFDTWFSSSSWPFATLDFPDGEEYKQFYPLSLMETGTDILYAWVSRMLMLGLYVTGEIPFEKVYLHGMVQDEHGAKMSKSKGNVINPMEKIDEFGSDAFRMGIIADETPASARPYDQSKIIGARNFCNKLWNVARFIEGALGEELKPNVKPEPKTAADHWVLDRLNIVGGEIGDKLERYRFSEAYEALYHLVWDDVADWYVEASKSAQNSSVLNYTLQTILKLAHPFAPFVTETIWQTLHENNEDLLAVSSWPTEVKVDASLAHSFEQVKVIVSEVRQVKTLLKLNGGTLIYTDEGFMKDAATTIAKLARLEAVSYAEAGKGLALTQTDQACWLDIDEKTAQQFVGSLSGREISVQKQIMQLEGRLGNEGYVQKAPEHLIQASRDQLAELQAELTLITQQIQQFSNL